MAADLTPLAELSSPPTAWYAPTRPIVQKSRELWDAWGLGTEFSVLFDFVSRRLGGESAPFTYSASFYFEQLKPHLANSSKREQRLGERLKGAIAHLECCLAYCVACRRCVPKPVGNFLHDAETLLTRARMTALEAESKYKADRRRGAAELNSPYALVQQRILELLRQHAPQDGWEDVVSATRTILPKVWQFILERQIKLEQHCLGPRIRGWIRQMPEAVPLFRGPMSAQPKRSRLQREVAQSTAVGESAEFLLSRHWMKSARPGEQSQDGF